MTEGVELSRGLAKKVDNFFKVNRSQQAGMSPQFAEPAPRRATCNAAIAEGDVGEVTMVGTGGVVKAYNPGPGTADGDIPVYWSAGNEVSTDNEDDPVRRGQWEIVTGGGASSGLPAGTVLSGDCQCGKSARGRAVTDCDDCDCVNMLRRTALPQITSLDEDAWPEVQEIIELNYVGGCVHESQKIPGVTCYVGEDDDEPVHDEYQFTVNYSTGIAELKCVTESPQCPVAYVKWEFCPSCAKECTSVWTLRRTEYTNVLLPGGDCQICITPLRDRTQTEITCSTCDAETGFVLPGEVTIRIADHPTPSTKLCGGAGVTIPAAYTTCTFNGNHLCTRPPNKEALWIAADYPADEWADSIEEDIEDFLSGSDPVMCDVVWAKQFVRAVCDSDPPCPEEGFAASQVVHWIWVWIEGTGGVFSVKAFLRAGESSSGSCGFFSESLYESASTYTCEELAALQDFDPETEDAPEVELEFVSGSDNNGSIGPFESLWFSFQIPADDLAPSSGHDGAECGPAEEERCTKPCRLVVATVEGTKFWRIKRSKGCGTAFCTCQGMEDYYCGGMVTEVSVCGAAADHDVGYECNVACVAEPTVIGQGVTVTLSPGVGCACSADSFFLCFVSISVTKTISFCGGSYNLTYSYDSGTDNWSLTFAETGGGATTFDTTSDPTGPFDLDLSAFAIAGTCTSLVGTVSV